MKFRPGAQAPDRFRAIPAKSSAADFSASA
jgi:hypothetical protein